jgi:hypothetical protein
MNWRSWLIFLNSLCFLTLLCSHLGQPIEDTVVCSGHANGNILLCVSASRATLLVINWL